MPMTYEDLDRALADCIRKLDACGIRDRPHDRDLITRAVLPSQLDMLRHALWMAEEARLFAWTKGQKAHRWLGFIQGVLWATGHSTVNQLKDANRPAADAVTP